jgi:hypothetical protein
MKGLGFVSKILWAGIKKVGTGLKNLAVKLAPKLKDFFIEQGQRWLDGIKALGPLIAEKGPGLIKKAFEGIWAMTKVVAPVIGQAVWATVKAGASFAKDLVFKGIPKLISTIFTGSTESKFAESALRNSKSARGAVITVFKEFFKHSFKIPGAILKTGLGVVKTLGKVLLGPFSIIFGAVGNAIVTPIKMAISGMGRSLVTTGSTIGKSLLEPITKFSKNLLAPLRNFAKMGVTKVAGAGAAKTVGKTFTKAGLRKIPVIGALISIPFAINDWKAGRKMDAIAGMASGLASMVPGIGTAASILMDLAYMSTKKDGFGGLQAAVKGGLKATGGIATASIKGIAKLGKTAKMLKKLPMIGALISIPLAIGKFRDGDVVGGLLEVGSGIASLDPGTGIGLAISIALDTITFFRDKSLIKKQAALEKVAEKYVPKKRVVGKTIWSYVDGVLMDQADAIQSSAHAVQTIKKTTNETTYAGKRLMAAQKYAIDSSSTNTVSDMKNIKSSAEIQAAAVSDITLNSIKTMATVDPHTRQINQLAKNQKRTTNQYVKALGDAYTGPVQALGAMGNVIASAINRYDFAGFVRGLNQTAGAVGGPLKLVTKTLDVVAERVTDVHLAIASSPAYKEMADKLKLERLEMPSNYSNISLSPKMDKPSDLRMSAPNISFPSSGFTGGNSSDFFGGENLTSSGVETGAEPEVGGSLNPGDKPLDPDRFKVTNASGVTDWTKQSSVVQDVEGILNSTGKAKHEKIWGSTYYEDGSSDGSGVHESFKLHEALGQSQFGGKGSYVRSSIEHAMGALSKNGALKSNNYMSAIQDRFDPRISNLEQVDPNELKYFADQATSSFLYGNETAKLMSSPGGAGLPGLHALRALADAESYNSPYDLADPKLAEFNSFMQYMFNEGGQGVNAAVGERIAMNGASGLEAKGNGFIEWGSLKNKFKGADFRKEMLSGEGVAPSIYKAWQDIQDTDNRKYESDEGLRWANWAGKHKDEQDLLKNKISDTKDKDSKLYKAAFKAAHGKTMEQYKEKDDVTLNENDSDNYLAYNDKWKSNPATAKKTGYYHRSGLFTLDGQSKSPGAHKAKFDEDAKYLEAGTMFPKYHFKGMNGYNTYWKLNSVKAIQGKYLPVNHKDKQMLWDVSGGKKKGKGGYAKGTRRSESKENKLKSVLYQTRKKAEKDLARMMPEGIEAKNLSQIKDREMLYNMWAKSSTSEDATAYRAMYGKEDKGKLTLGKRDTIAKLYGKGLDAALNMFGGDEDGEIATLRKMIANDGVEGPALGLTDAEKNPDNPFGYNEKQLKTMGFTGAQRDNLSFNPLTGKYDDITDSGVNLSAHQLKLIEGIKTGGEQRLFTSDKDEQVNWGVNAGFKTNLMGMAKDFLISRVLSNGNSANANDKLKINSGFRTQKDQQRIWLKKAKKNKFTPDVLYNKYLKHVGGKEEDVPKYAQMLKGKHKHGDWDLPTMLESISTGKLNGVRKPNRIPGVANPGGPTAHTTGNAIDIDSSAANALAGTVLPGDKTSIMEKWGITRPLLSGSPFGGAKTYNSARNKKAVQETWHLQPYGTAGMGEGELQTYKAPPSTSTVGSTGMDLGGENYSDNYSMATTSSSKQNIVTETADNTVANQDLELLNKGTMDVKVTNKIELAPETLKQLSELIVNKQQNINNNNSQQQKNVSRNRINVFS